MFSNVLSVRYPISEYYARLGPNLPGGSIWMMSHRQRAREHSGMFCDATKDALQALGVKAICPILCNVIGMPFWNILMVQQGCAAGHLSRSFAQHCAI